MTYASTCPAAIAGLIAALGRSQALSGVLVTDGGGITDPDADEVISVGYAGEADEMAAEGSMALEGSGARDRERYDVHCAAAVVTGDDTASGLAVIRERAFELLAAIGEALATDPLLGGAVMSASLGSWSFRSDRTSGGAFARIRFDVSVDAYTQR